MCRYFVNAVLHISHARFPNAHVIHYMDKILLSCYTNKELESSYKYVLTCLQAAGLKVVTGKNSDFAFILILGFCIKEYCNASPKDFNLSKKSIDTK